MWRSDPALVEACLRGEKSAWDELVERYGRLVYSIPRRYGLSPADADDVFQNVFVTAYRSLGNLRDQTRLSAWLITTAHRESWRIGKRADRYADLDERIADVAAPDENDLLAWERQHLVRQGLVTLGGTCEKLLKLIFMNEENPSYEAVATELGMKVGSIGPTRARCLEKLEKILAESGLFEAGDR